MGTSESKEKGNTTAQEIRHSSKRSKNRQSTKSFQIETGLQILNNLKSEIDIFAGNRQSARYSEFHEILTTISKDIHQIKAKSSKQIIRDQCDETLGEVQNCFQRLETRIHLNEQNDKNLDLAAIESHSFINQSFTKQQPSQISPLTKQNLSQEVQQPVKQRQPKLEFIDTLDRLEREMFNIEKEVRTCIDLQDFSQYKVLERKIELLYTDLEMIPIDNHTPLNERKVTIGKRLIKFNSQLRKSKRAAAKQETPQKDELAKIEHKLENVEIQVLTFEGTQKDKRYSELKQTLENYLSTISAINYQTEEDKQKYELTVVRIKNILHELQTVADNNEKQTAAIQIMHKIETDVQQLKIFSDEFQGNTSDPKYLELDQSLRSYWAQLSNIGELNEIAKRSKSRIINEIQYILKKLSDKAKKQESTEKIILTEEDRTNDEILQTQLLNQVKEFKNHWEQLNHNLGENITNSEIRNSIYEIFRDTINGINKRIDSLQHTSLNNISVTANFLQETQPHAKPRDHQNISDRFEVTKPLETEIKVQPTVKTIGEMQRIGAEAKELVQHLRRSSCTKDDNDYKMYEKKLQQCKEALANISYNKGSSTIESNRRRASKLINEGFHLLEEKVMQRGDNEKTVAAIRSSRAHEIMDIDAEMQYLRQQIKNITSVVKDKQYDKIKSGLTECLAKLQVTDDSHVGKQEKIQQIQRYHQELETRLAENQAKVRIMEQTAEARQDIKHIIEEVQTIKSQIERFSGTYNGLQFNQIQDNLNNLSTKLEVVEVKNDEKLQNSKAQVQQKILKYLKILEDKSTKVQIQQEDEQNPNGQFRSSIIVNSPHHKINSLRDKLVRIKDSTETFSGKFKDAEYKSIENDMLQCLDELRSIDDGGHKSVITSKQQYHDYIHKLMQYFEDKTKTDDLKRHEETTAFNTKDPVEELSVLEIKIDEFEEKVEGFDGTPNDTAYKELCASSVSLTKELDKIQAGNVVQMRERKRKLMEELEFATKRLEDRANNKLEIELAGQQIQLTKIEGIVNQVNEISNEVAVFQGVKNDPTYCYLDESLIKMMIELDNIGASRYSAVKDAKKQAIQLIQRNVNILLEKVASRDGRTAVC